MADANAQQAPANSSKMGKILGIGFAVLNLVVTGGGAFLVYKSTLGWESPQITELSSQAELSNKVEEQYNEPLIYTMEKFTVNLTGEPKRVIRVEVNLNMLSKDGFEEVMISDNRAKARDSVVQILNQKTFAEVESIQGKLFLKDQISVALNSLLDKGVVKDIYFTDFVVQ